MRLQLDAVTPRGPLVFVPQTWRTCGGGAALLLLLLFLFSLCASLQGVLLPEDLLRAEPLELVLWIESMPSLNLMSRL